LIPEETLALGNKFLCAGLTRGNLPVSKAGGKARRLYRQPAQADDIVMDDQNICWGGEVLRRSLSCSRREDLAIPRAEHPTLRNQHHLRSIGTLFVDGWRWDQRFEDWRVTDVYPGNTRQCRRGLGPRMDANDFYFLSKMASNGQSALMELSKRTRQAAYRLLRHRLSARFHH